MIIKARYRDIPWEEIPEKCRIAPYFDIPRLRDTWEKDLRGKPISLETPPMMEGHWGCNEPHYHILNSGRLACCGIAEIGD